jgi:hypothetical protein
MPEIPRGKIWALISPLIGRCFRPFSAMRSRLIAALVLLIASLAPTAFAGGKADNKVSASFHLETEASDNPKMMFPQQFGGQTHYFRRMPEISTKDIVSFNPFPATGGDGYDLVFKLKGNAATRLAAITNANQGRWLVAQINGRIVDGVLIDREIDDGLLVVWKGATLADIHLFDKEMPRFGEGTKKTKKAK